jgi:hypothetical protein
LVPAEQIAARLRRALLEREAASCERWLAQDGSATL